MAGIKPWGDGPLEVWINNSTGGGDVTITGEVAISNWPPDQEPLTDTQLRAAPLEVTGDLSVEFPPSQAVTGPVTNAELRAAPVSVSGTVSATCSGTVAVSNFPASQAVTGTFFQATQPVSGPLTDAQLRATPVPISGNLTSAPQPSTLCVTSTAAGAAACTLTLPAVPGQFHYITSLRITKYGFAAVTGTNTPVLVTSSNLPGNPVWTFARAHVIGSTDHQMLELPGNPLKSSVVNTATTIVCPATTGFLWRVTAFYYAAA